MSKRILHHWFFVISLIGVVLLILTGTMPVRAQCEGPQTSSCSTCHAQEDPVNDKGEWHIIHARKDICINCHGGNGTEMDKDLAHENLTAHPLDDIYTDCHSCHPDYDERADLFAQVLDVTPGSCATPTPVPVGNTSNGQPPSNINLQTDGMNITLSRPLLALGVILTILLLFFFGIGWLEKHHVGI